MSSNYQSTAFQSSAKPVDTFVVQPKVLPKTGAEELASILETVNPNLQKFLSLKIEDAAEEEREKINLEIAKKGFKTVAKEHRDQHGDDAANRLIGGSIFADDEFDKVKTQLLANTYANEVTSLYNSKTYEITTDKGNTVNVPITYFPIDSPEYQNFLGEISTIGGNLAATTKGKYLTDYFYPAQSKVIQKITEDHINAHNDYSFNKLSKQTYPTIISAYTKWQDGDKDDALTTINDFINNKVLLGVTQDKQNKFFDNLLEYTKSLRAEAFTVDGLDGSNSVLEMMRGIKYGPDGSSIFETHPKFLSEMHKQTIEQIKQGEEIERIDNNNLKEEAESGILLLVNELGVKEGDLPYATIERIKQFGSKYNVDVDWIDNKIDIFIPDRQKTLIDFSLSLTEGAYLGQPLKASKALGVILNSLGPLTDKEEGIKTKIISQIESSRKGQTDGGKQELNSIIQRLRKQINPTYDSFQQVWNLLEGEEDPTSFMLDLERKLSRDYEIWLRYTDENDDGVYETRTKQQIFEYLNKIEDEAILKIKNDWDDGGDNNSITLPNEIFKGLSKDDAYEKITIDGQTAYRNKESNQIYVSDESVVEEGGSNQALDPLNRTKRKNINTNNLEPGFFTESTQEDIDREKALDAAEANSYLIQAGDTLTSIAESFGTTVEDIMEANNITDPNVIKKGQELIMPIVKMIGDAVIPESNLTNRSVLEEIDITQPFTYNSLYRLALEVGFPPEDARIAAAIALAESSGRAGIDTVQSGLDRNKENEFSLGLWQIDMQDTPGYMVGKERRPQFGIKSNEELYNPLTNAKAAKILYDRAGGKFTDWATFRDGKYKKFLPKN